MRPTPTHRDEFPDFGIVFEHALDAVVAMDSTGMITAWNSSAADLFGWSADEAIGRILGDLIVPPGLRDAHSNGLARYLETGEGPVLNKRIEISAVRRDGDEFPIELSVVPVRRDGKPWFIGFIRSREREVEAERTREDRTRLAETLASIAEAQLAGLSTQDFVRLCLKRICEATGWAAGHLYEVDNVDRPREMVPSDIWHFAAPKLEPMRQISHDHRFAFGVGLPGQVWQSGEMQMIEDIESTTTFLRREPFLAAGIHKAFAFPVRDSSQIVGVAEFFGLEGARSDPQMQLFVKTIASHVSLAILRNREAEIEQVRLRETKHRISNSFAVLASIFRQCADSAEDVAGLQSSFEPRLQAMAHAHSLRNASGQNLPDLERAVVQALAIIPDQSAVTISGPHIPLGENMIDPMTLILGELVTNSLKHGAWKDRSGRLSVEWSLPDDGEQARLVWRETPASPPAEPLRTGYGTTLLDIMIRQSLRGEFERRFEDDGYVFVMSWPITALSG
jgi:PAS domain S-box-containing protein